MHFIILCEKVSFEEALGQGTLLSPSPLEKFQKEVSALYLDVLVRVADDMCENNLEKPSIGY